MSWRDDPGIVCLVCVRGLDLLTVYVQKRLPNRQRRNERGLGIRCVGKWIVGTGHGVGSLCARWVELRHHAPLGDGEPIQLRRALN